MVILRAMKIKTDTRKLMSNTQQIMRGEIVHLRMLGKSNRYVAETVGVSERHASSIWQRYLREGNAAIISRKRGRREGEQMVLNHDQEIEVLKMLNKKPSCFRIESQLWTRCFLQQAIKNHLKIDVSIRTIGVRLKLWGMVPQRPIVLNSEFNSPEIRRWINNDYQKIVERSQQEGAEIQWCIEKDFGSNSMYLLPVPPVKGVFMLASITNQGQIRFMLNRSEISSKSFIEFVTRLIVDTGRKVILLMQPSICLYHDKMVEEWLVANMAKVELVCFPVVI